MPDCRHEELDFVGEQKDDDGVNTYFRCKRCGSTVVVTPGRKVFAVPGAKNRQ